MRLEPVPGCPVGGERGEIAVASVEDSFFDTPGEWQYRQGKATGHLWLDPRPTEEHIAELYQKYYTHSAPPDRTASIWQQAMTIALARRLGYRRSVPVGRIARLVSRLPSVGDTAELEVMRIPATVTGSLLDVGCGSGSFLARMRKVGWSVVGTEPDPKAAARLTETLGIQVHSNIDDLRGQRFDLITLSHVIEHVSDPVSLLRQLGALLATNGKLVLTTPNSKSLGYRLFQRHWRGLEPPRHFNVFSPESLKQAIGAANLRVERIDCPVRMARGIFYLSYLARRGHHGLEVGARPQSRLLKVAGYFFQVFEAVAVRLFPGCGEEIYCSAVLAREGN